MHTLRFGRIPRGLVRRLALAFLFAGVALAAAVLAPPSALADRGEIGPPHARILWRTIPHVPCPGQPVTIRFFQCACAWDLTSAAFEPQQGLVLRLVGDSTRVCVACHPDSVDVTLPGSFAAGNHSIAVTMRFNEGTPAASLFSDVVTFAVGPSCPGASLPYLEHIELGDGRPCPECPFTVSPCDSVTLRLGGTFPNACRHLLRVTLLPNPTATPLPAPPTVLLTYGNRSACALCTPEPSPWEVTVGLPRQPYLGGLVQQLPIEAIEYDVCANDSIPLLLGRIHVPFVVAQRCSTPPDSGCFNVAWSDSAPGRCNATVGKTDPARLVFRVGSTAPIAGIEGTLSLDTDALAIGPLTAVRDGWVVQSSTTPDGSTRFVAFATSPGAAIPGSPGGVPQDVFAVGAHLANVRVVQPDVARLAARELLVSDGAGHAIRMCPVITLVDPPPSVALLCRSARCDANGDGRSDVRDLVVMVRCIAADVGDGPSCPDPSIGLDCTADGILDLEDVFCCARVLLGGDRPDSTGGDSLRAAPSIALGFGLPVALEDGLLEVPLRFAGLAGTGLAALRLDLAYPDVRYEVAGVQFDGWEGWWSLHEARAGRLRLALINLAATGQPVLLDALPAGARIVLRPRAGAPAGGELVIVDAEFAASDGVLLSTPNAGGRIALGPANQALLSAPRPNPFAAGGTSFALTVPAAGPVDVGVFDVAGRRVATLMREGAASPGVYTLRWDGRLDGGGSAPGGVYFVRLVAGSGAGAGDGAARKLLYLPGAAR